MGRVTGAPVVYRAKLVRPPERTRSRRVRRVRRIGEDPVYGPELPPEMAVEREKGPPPGALIIATEQGVSDDELYREIAEALLILADRRPPGRFGVYQGDLYGDVRNYNAAAGIRWYFLPVDSPPRAVYASNSEGSGGALVTEFSDGSTRYDWPLQDLTVWELSGSGSRKQGYAVACRGRENWYQEISAADGLELWDRQVAEALYYAMPVNIIEDSYFTIRDHVESQFAAHGYVEDSDLDGARKAALGLLWGLATAPAKVMAANLDTVAESKVGDAVVVAYEDGKKAVAKVYEDANARVNELIDLLPWMIGGAVVLGVAAAVATTAGSGAVVAGAGAYALGPGGLGYLTRAYAASKGVPT